MARSLSIDLRRRVVGAIEGGLSCRAAARRFGVSASSAIRWRAQERREGDVRPKRQGGDRHSHRIEAHAELILSALAAKSDVTLAGTAGRVEGAWRRRRHRHTLAVLQTPQDHAQKKSAHAAEQRRNAVNAAREAWFEGQLDLDPTRIVFIDETRREHQDGAPLRSCPQGRAMPRSRAPWPLENHHLHRLSALTTASLRRWSSTAR